ncbi:MAG: hypothetical protein RMK29_08995 [Myxococcales bacterium]|nr:hypothetical protein [Myxococcota bacterium]MDW8281834.1 hypothetical protein [Myxococcales bacterium]
MRIWWWLTLMCIGAAGCSLTNSHIHQLERQLVQVTWSLRELADRVHRVERRAFCPPIVKELLEAVQKNASCNLDNICQGQDAISATFVEQDPVKRGRFIALLGSQPYVVLYPYLPPDRPRHQYPFMFRSMDLWQLKRLEQLVSPPWLPITKFLIVSNSGRDRNIDRAKARIAYIVKLMSEMRFVSFPHEQFVLRDKDDPSQGLKMVRRDEFRSGTQMGVLRWVFSFSLQPEEIVNDLDLPPFERMQRRMQQRGRTVAERQHLMAQKPPGEPTLDDSLFVFRIDCPTDDFAL